MILKKKSFLKSVFNSTNLTYGHITPDDNLNRRIVETITLSANNTTSNTATPTVYLYLVPITGASEASVIVAKFKVNLGTDLQVHNINMIVPENMKMRVSCPSAGDYLTVTATYVETPHIEEI